MRGAVMEQVRGEISRTALTLGGDTTAGTECRGGEQTLKRMAEHHAIKGIDQTGMLDLKYINSTKDRMQRRRANPKRMAEHHAIKGIDQPGMLDIKYINSTKGRGVFAMAPFTKGEFVVEYRGQLIDFTESERRRRVYNPKCSVFMYDLMWHDKMWWWRPPSSKWR
ncbi:N-lysine methyltransferase KMT5A-A-like isoform X5 [Thalassophryne amazonica]|uniref:N-lysine methyltransferase KMT5A-A-like isoform X5 n=1 Tax=Thalassophryne amazonica TaxID=390379 RepID=UPI001471D0BD|nr:N-lysine methyltransferase KMT5A-A-like isoform X5 [Thalassophryne amazonica]